MDWWRPEYAFPILGAVVAGALIGFDREYRGRAAGLRTHILVSLTSALLMLAAVHQVRWMTDTPHDVIRIDPVRMAHGVLTGIGFLCGGVIFREGFSVRGLTTAASLWITAALGGLYGIGFYGVAISGTVVTLIVLSGLRFLDGRLPQLHHLDVAVRYRGRDLVSEDEFRALFAEFKLKPDVVSHRLLAAEDIVELAATFSGVGRAPSQAIAARLLADARVAAFDLAPRHE